MEERAQSCSVPGGRPEPDEPAERDRFCGAVFGDGFGCAPERVGEVDAGVLDKANNCVDTSACSTLAVGQEVFASGFFDYFHVYQQALQFREFGAFGQQVVAHR